MQPLKVSLLEDDALTSLMVELMSRYFLDALHIIEDGL